MSTVLSGNGKKTRTIKNTGQLVEFQSEIQGLFAYFYLKKGFMQSKNAMNRFNQVPAWLLTILRLYLGVILLYTVIGKLTAASPFVDEMLGFLDFEIKAGRPPGFYLSFLQGVVIPHAVLVSYLVLTGELIAGLGLLTGTLTRLSAFIALVLFINYLFAKGRWFWSPDSEDAAVFFIALVLMLGAAGRFFGVDHYLANRWPKSLLW